MKSVLSASRRTDIPAFYMDWFMQGIHNEFFEVQNPYNHKTFVVPASTTDVHTIVLWSKNFGPFITGDYGRQLQEKGYHLFFNFTLNSMPKILEPRLPPLTQRLAQLEVLCRRYNPGSINWRFDPICFFQTDGHGVQDNLDDFSFIAEKAAALGVEYCVTSFVDIYPKISKRLTHHPGIKLVDVGMARKITTLKAMCRVLEPMGISLQTCCEKGLLEQVADILPLERSACIPNDRIMKLFGGRISLGKDQGQRVKAGCGCFKSIDIGSYRQQPCGHGCLYCYANPCL